MMDNKVGRFKNLDSIRTIAFISTFLAHSFYTLDQSILENEIYIKVNSLKSIFSFGVPTFFVLSGFLISYLMLKEQETGFFNIKNFYVRRILRIWPLYFLILFIGFILFPLLRENLLHTGYNENANPVMYILFLSNFDQIFNDQLPFGVGLGPTWSVSIEEQFYLLWPILLLIFKRKNFIIPITFTFLGCILLSMIYELPGKHTLTSMIYLSAGSIFAYLAFYKPNIRKKITEVNPIIFVSIIILLIAFIQMVYIPYLKTGIIALLIGYIIVYQSYTQTFEFRRIPLFERVGKYTYSLYLCHVICNFIVYTFFEKILHIEDTLLNTLAIKPIFSLILSVIVSILSYSYFESFFLVLKEKYFSRTK